jgi:mannose-1-phosphate guanylyltransferase
MLQATVDRLGDVVPPDRVLVATTTILAGQVAEQLSQLPREAILAEPCKRDTAPCIGLAAVFVSRKDEDATMAVMPADHVIAPDESFQEAIRFAAAVVEETPGRIVTFGIRPTYPAESFGYIERDEELPTAAAESFEYPPPIYRVKQFREKPKIDVAWQYLRAGTFYWNSGIFVWKARTILEALAQHRPKLYARLERIADAAGTRRFEEVLNLEFAALESISIDYAVMEHARDVSVIEAPFDWDDVGSWQALSRLRGEDADGNTISAKHLGLATKRCIVRSTEGDHLVATVGVDDLIIVHTPDATLVARKDREEAVRDLVRQLRERGMEEYM